MVDVLPRQLRHMDEPVHATEVHEGAKVHDRRHHTLTDLARLEVGQEILALFLLGFFQPSPAGQHHVVAVLVELDDLGFEAPTHIGLEVAHAAQLDQGRGQEAAEADVNDETALDDLDDRAADDAFFFFDLLDRAPGPFVLGPLLGQYETALLVLLLEDKGFDGIAQRHDLARIDVVADRQLTSRDHPLGLIADVEQDLVPIDLHHRALDDLAVLDLHHGGGIGVVHGHAAEIVLGHLPGDVAAIIGERAHAGRRRRRRAGVSRFRGRFDRFGVGFVGGDGLGGLGGRSHLGGFRTDLLGHVIAFSGFSGHAARGGARRAGRSTRAGAQSVPSHRNAPQPGDPDVDPDVSPAGQR